MPQTEPVAPRSRLLTASYVMAFASSHFLFVGYNMSLVEVPRALSGEASWVVGVVVGVMGISGMMMRPLSGVFVDGGHRQRWLRAGAIGVFCSFVGYSLGLGPWIASIFRLLHGLSMALCTTSLLAIVGSSLPADRRGTGLGIYQTSHAIAQLYAATMAIWLIGAASIQVAFLVSAAASGAALAFGVGAGDPSPPAPRAAASWRTRAWISRPALPLGLVFLMMTTPWGVIVAFLPDFADARGLGNPGHFYFVVAIAQVLTRSMVGSLTDRLGRTAVIVPALGLGAVGLLVLAGAHGYEMMLAAAMLYGLGLSATQTAIVALVVDRAPRAELGAGMATYTMAWDVGTVVGSSGLGFLVNAVGPAPVFALVAALPLAGIAITLTRLREPRRASPRA